MEVTSVRTDQETSSGGDSRRRTTLFLIFLIVVIDLIGFGIIMPLLPMFGHKFVEPLYPGRPQLGGVLLGLLMSSFSVMQFVFAPIWGRLSDRLGRKPILLLGLGASSLSYGVLGWGLEVGEQGGAALGLGLLFAARLMAGIAGGTISTAQAVIADTTSTEGRSRGMALIGAGFGFGFTFGPILGYAATYLPFAGAPGYAAAALSAIAFALTASLLPETLRADTTGLRRHWLDVRGTVEVLRMPTIGLLVLTFFLATMVFGELEVTMPLINELFLTGQDTGVERDLLRDAEARRGNLLIFCYIGFVLMVVQGFLYRRLVQRVGEVRFLLMGLVLMTLGLSAAVLLLFTRGQFESRPTALGCALAVMTVTVTGFALLTPSVHALISQRSDPQRQGEVLGVNQSGSALARIAGPICGLSLYFVDESHAGPYVLGVVLLAAVLAVGWHRLRLPMDR